MSHFPIHRWLYSGQSQIRCIIGVAVCMTSLACSSLTDVLNVPPPAGVETAAGLASQGGAEAAFNAAKAKFFGSVAYVGVYFPGLLSDEFTFAQFVFDQYGGDSNIDARRTSPTGVHQDDGTSLLSNLLVARSDLLLAAPKLAQYEPAAGQQKVGEAFALIGHIELMLAEDFCAGIPLSRDLPGSGIEYGTPLTLDSLYGTALTHFDSALAHANGDPEILALAHLGAARAHLGRGEFAAAGTSASLANVPTDFVYNIETSPDGSVGGVNLYQVVAAYGACEPFNVSDREGGVGVDYISANDPRLGFSTTAGLTCDSAYSALAAAPLVTGPLYFPTKFNPPSTSIPLASGVDARLIEAEAALHANNIGLWTSLLDELRAIAPSTYVHAVNAIAPLSDDSTTTASSDLRIDVMFRERAFWLFGTGKRLADMRRLVRRYNRTVDQVYPHGGYIGAMQNSDITTYGGDISLAIPSPTTTQNPQYHGCMGGSAAHDE